MRQRLPGLLAVVVLLGSSAALRGEIFTAYLNAAQEVPTNASTAKGYARIFLNPGTGSFSYTVVYSGLSSAQTSARISGPAAIGTNGPLVAALGAAGGTSGTLTGTGLLTPAQIAQLRAKQLYVEVQSTSNPAGEIRGQLAFPRPVDYDGDGRTDYSVLRFPNVSPPGVSPITYYNLNSTAGFQSQAWGNANTDFPAPGDYDGDGKGDIAVYRQGASPGDPSFFFILRSSDGGFQTVQWGVFGDQTVARDYDGDGITDIAVFRRGAALGDPAFWYILQSTTGTIRVVSWGTTGNGTSSGDTPVPADYDGDGKFDVAVYRFGGLSPDNTFLIQRSSDGAFVQQPWGTFNSDYVLAADFDGDGKADVTAVRTGASATAPMTWYILQSSTGTLRTQVWGQSSDFPTQGDYDGDGRTDISVYRQGATTGSANFFYTLGSLGNVFLSQSWGVRGDFPVNTFDVR